MYINQGSADYFKNYPGFDRFFRNLEKKWASYGRLPSKIMLMNCTQEERLAMESFLGRRARGQHFAIPISEFEQALLDSNLPEKDLYQILCDYLDRKVMYRTETRMEEKSRKNAFFDRLQESFDDAAGGEWLLAARKNGIVGRNYMLSLWREDEKKAETLISAVCHSLNFLEEQSAAEETDLAVLAARATGNPHAFDRGTEGGQLLTKALCWWKKAGTPGNTLEYNRLYRDAGIRLDALASRVAAFGLRFYKDDGRLHEGFAGFCREGEPFVVTAANMEHIDRIEAEADKVYIVENEMVFTTLCKAMTGRAVSLLCTSGQLRTVAYQVMDLLAACGCMLYYSGDLDPEGMGIADRLLQRYPQHLHLWHMELEDYRSSLSEELLTSRRLHKLEGLACPQLKAVGEEMSRKKRAGYQEHLIEKMLEDLQA